LVHAAAADDGRWLDRRRRLISDAPNIPDKPTKANNGDDALGSLRRARSRVTRYDAIVLAGGGAVRLGGRDKAMIEFDGRPLLDRVLAAVADAERVVVVGPSRPQWQPTPSSRQVIWAREQPPGGGPAAALAAGLSHTRTDRLITLAVDQPWIAPAVPRLLAALGPLGPLDPLEPVDADGGSAAMLVDAAGRRNYLAAAWRRTELASVLGSFDQLTGISMRALFERVDPVLVPDEGDWGADIDHPGDLEASRARLRARDTRRRQEPAP
jgi:molybdopterin-guanine dinucleotide biosynthesis protein A